MLSLIFDSEITDERTSVPQPSQYPSPTTTTTNLKPDSREVLTQQPQHSARKCINVFVTKTVYVSNENLIIIH